jgi:hypothetical protein
MYASKLICTEMAESRTSRSATGFNRAPQRPANEDLVMGKLRRSAFLIGLACGAGIWLLSPLVTRRSEPWDAAGGYYPWALFLTGLLGGLVVPSHPAALALGIVVGQALVLLGRVVADPTGGGLWPLGILFLGVYGVVALGGAAVGSLVGRRHRAKAPRG